MGIRGRGFPDWPPVLRREEQRWLEKEATKLLRDDRARQRQRESAPKPNTTVPEAVLRNGGWVNLGDLRMALRKKRGAIRVRKAN
jgi:hypothetical protein